MQGPYNYFEYRAGCGDTFYSLARKFLVNERELRAYNPDTEMAEGQMIKIPSRYGGCPGGVFYAIKRGETLFRIAKRNGISMETLLRANPYLNPGYYLPGQVIIVPRRKQSAFGGHYTLGRREGLVDVLKKYNMDVTTFCRLNPGVNPMDVQSGQRVAVARQKGEDLSAAWYVIRQGDTLVSVAGRFGIHVSELLSANGQMRPSEFVPGKRIYIPPKSPGGC